MQAKVGEVGKAIACGASENMKEGLSLAKYRKLEANDSFKLSSDI